MPRLAPGYPFLTFKDWKLEVYPNKKMCEDAQL